jgi:hypothetical protein
MTLTLLQGLFTVICLESMRRMGYIDYHPWSWSLVWKVSAERARRRLLASRNPP